MTNDTKILVILFIIFIVFPFALLILFTFIDMLFWNKEERYCPDGSKHDKRYRVGDRCEGQWHCPKCGSSWGPTGIFDFGFVAGPYAKKED